MIEATFIDGDGGVEEIVDRLNLAVDQGCLRQPDADRFINRFRGMEGEGRFNSVLAQRSVEDLSDAFGVSTAEVYETETGDRLRQAMETRSPTASGGGQGTADVLTFRDVDGDVQLEIEVGDAIEVSFINTHSRKRDTVQGVIERIQGGGEHVGFITLTNGIVFSPSSGGSVRINDRRRGLLPRDEPPHANIRHLFQSSGGAGQATITGDVEEEDRADELLAAVRRAQSEIPPGRGQRQPFPAAQETINRVVGQIAEEAPSPFADSIDELVDELEALKRSWVRWMSDHVSSTTTVRDRRVSLERVIEALTTNRGTAQKTARAFLQEYGNA